MLSARSEITDELSLFCALRYWWSKEYKRPYKDPLLASYTLEELAMEYYDKVERLKVETERLSENSDKIETNKVAEALDWAEQEEARELLEEQRKADKPSDQTEEQFHEPSPEDEEWMNKQVNGELQKMKEEYGEDFGEDIVGSEED